MKKGMLVGIRFLDHYMDSGTPKDPIICDITGVLVKEDEHHLYVYSWIVNSNVTDDNNEFFAILKSTILERFVLHFERVQTFKNKESYEVKPRNVGSDNPGFSDLSSILERKIKEQKDRKAAERSRAGSKRSSALQARRNAAGATR